MQVLLLVLAAGLITLGYWTSTLGKSEIQAALSIELIAFGALLAVFGLVEGRLQHRDRHRDRA